MKKRIITGVLCGLMILNTGIISAFADLPVSLEGKSKEEITTSNPGDGGNLQVSDGQVDGSFGVKPVPPTTTTTKNPPKTDNTKEQKETKDKNEGDPGGVVETETPETTVQPEVIPGNQWTISEGWVWSLSEWGKRNDWFTDAKNDGDSSWWDDNRIKVTKL